MTIPNTVTFTPGTPVTVTCPANAVLTSVNGYSWTVRSPEESLFDIWVKFVNKNKINHNDPRISHHYPGLYCGADWGMTSHSALSVTSNGLSWTVGSGNQAAPMYTFASDPNTGFYRASPEYPDTLFGVWEKWLNEKQKLTKNGDHYFTQDNLGFTTSGVSSLGLTP